MFARCAPQYRMGALPARADQAVPECRGNCGHPRSVIRLPQRRPSRVASYACGRYRKARALPSYGAGPAAGVQRDSRQSGHLVRCPSTGAAPAVTAARDAFGCDNQAGRHVVTGQRDRTGGRNRTVPVCVPARPPAVASADSRPGDRRPCPAARRPHRPWRIHHHHVGWGQPIQRDAASGPRCAANRRLARVCRRALAPLLAGRHAKLPAPVERLVLVKDVGSHGRAPACLSI